jgi:uncharacterized membrane protein
VHASPPRGGDRGSTCAIGQRGAFDLNHGTVMIALRSCCKGPAEEVQVVAERRTTLASTVPHPHRASNPHERVSKGYSRQDRIALAITAAVGTMYAVYFLAAFMVGWMLVQTAAGNGAFDPFPFIFLLFLGNIVQLLLMPLIMVGQNLQGKHAEARAEEEFQTTQKTFADAETTMRHLDAQDAELIRQTALLRALVERLLPAEDVRRIEAPDHLSRPAAGFA